MPRHPAIKRGRKPPGFPSRITLFGFEVTIIYCRQMPKEYRDSFGAAYFTDRRIYISLEQSKEEMERTLFHEICHLLLFLSGHTFRLTEEDEEAIVRALEHGMLQLYKRRRI